MKPSVAARSPRERPMLLGGLVMLAARRCSWNESSSVLMSAVERLRFVIVFERRIVDSVDLDGMPSLRAMSAVVFGLVLSVGFGCTVKYGVFWARDAKAKVLDVLGLVLVLAAVAAARSAAVGETGMSRAPPWESEVGRTPPELRVFGVKPPRGTGYTAPPR
jgi:hypothetical protein